MDGWKFLGLMIGEHKKNPNQLKSLFEGLILMCRSKRCRNQPHYDLYRLSRPILYISRCDELLFLCLDGEDLEIEYYQVNIRTIKMRGMLH